MDDSSNEKSSFQRSDDNNSEKFEESAQTQGKEKLPM